jgi:DNA mismatch repair protein MutS
LQVASLAGLPKKVVSDARGYLSELEAGDRGPSMRRDVQPSPQLGLFNEPPSPVLAEIDRIDPDTLSPREALEALYRLKNLR